jgi:hypothetical protein
MRVKSLAWAAIAAFGVVSPALAQPQPADPKSPDDWRFSVAFYGWATNLSGNATARGNTASFNASIIDIFQKSDSVAAWDSYFEVNKGRFGAYFDFVWSKVQMPKSAASYSNPIGGVTLSAQANAAVTSSLTIVEAGGVYELANWPGSGGSSTSLDAFAGIRYWNTSAQINLDLTGTLDFSDPRLGRFDRSKSIGVADTGSLQWVDPLIGLRVRHIFTPNQQIAARADIGGFGIQGSSLFSWQLVGVYSYTWQFSGYTLSALGGYRALSTSVSFDSGINQSGLNLLIHGPLLGLSVKF